ncbi:MAG TPA: hypothetical protein VJ550_12130 [Geomonas sp.]|nr:hypothetical protein [Geomonas sp.]
MRMHKITAIVITLLALSGCGGGGSTQSAGSVPGNAVSGVASKGIIKNGTVRVYAINADGSKGALLRQTTTDKDTGSYRADLGSYSGAVVIEISGSYTDEATGQLKTVSADAPLRAALASVSGEVSAAVTPLTEMAVEKVENSVSRRISVADIAASNALIASIFRVDILKTMPVDPTVASSSGLEQREYALVLAGISALMQSEGKDLAAVIAEVRDAVTSDGRMSGLVAGSLLQGISSFAASGGNQTGIKDVSNTPLVNIGQVLRPLAISLSGTSSLLSGVDFLLTLPPGVVVSADANGVVAGADLQGAVGTLATGYYTPATESTRGKVHFAVASGSSFPATSFLTLQCVVAPGVTLSSADFGYTLVQAVDSNLLQLEGVTVSGALGQ